MQPQRIPVQDRDAASRSGAPSVVPRRSQRRATARRASSRRATARMLHDDVPGRIAAYVDEHPRSTVGDVAKALGLERTIVAAGLRRLAAARRVSGG